MKTVVYIRCVPRSPQKDMWWHWGGGKYYKLKKFCILRWYQSISCVIRRRVATVYTSRASLNLWRLKRWQQTVIHRRLICLIPRKKCRFCTGESKRFMIGWVLLIYETLRCLTDGDYHRCWRFTYVQSAVGERCWNTVKVGVFIWDENLTALFR